MITALIFVGTYAVVAFGRTPFLRLDRTGAAIVGAILMVVTGAIGFDDAVRSIDFRTIVLLFGMMVIVAHLRLAVFVVVNAGERAGLDARTFLRLPAPGSGHAES